MQTSKNPTVRFSVEKNLIHAMHKLENVLIFTFTKILTNLLFEVSQFSQIHFGI